MSIAETKLIAPKIDDFDLHLMHAIEDSLQLQLMAHESHCQVTSSPRVPFVMQDSLLRKSRASVSRLFLFGVLLERPKQHTCATEGFLQTILAERLLLVIAVTYLCGWVSKNLYAANVVIVPAVESIKVTEYARNANNHGDTDYGMAILRTPRKLRVQFRDADCSC